MFPKRFISLTIMTIGLLGAALVDGKAAPAAAQEVSYPWCTEGSAFHCYYMNRQQCEETVDYHGFCVPNPNASPQNNEATRPTNKG